MLKALLNVEELMGLWLANPRNAYLVDQSTLFGPGEKSTDTLGAAWIIDEPLVHVALIQIAKSFTADFKVAEQVKGCSELCTKRPAGRFGEVTPQRTPASTRQFEPI
ncbi:hypothetical protein [Saccharopolyspora sp. NPDC002686]|uniref:hypothetical protein n=1 Tax=Saccharopolyspora sp. NPDC002686 TaxID=3154541 RepID=UPI00332B5A2D